MQASEAIVAIQVVDDVPHDRIPPLVTKEGRASLFQNGFDDSGKWFPVRNSSRVAPGCNKTVLRGKIGFIG